MALEQELATYRREFERIRDREGEYVLVKDDQIVDFFKSYEDALKAGYERFKLEPFLVKRVEAVEQVQYFTRELTCPT